MTKFNFAGLVLAGALLLGMTAAAQQQQSSPATPQQPAPAAQQPAAPTDNPAAQTPAATSEAPTTPSMKQAPEQTPSAAPSQQAPDQASPSAAPPAQAPAETPSTQTPSKQAPAAQAPASGSSAASTGMGGAQSFSGKIEKEKGKLVLKDRSGTKYQLDDQDKAKQFKGKEVTINGSVDTASNTIHVQDISEAAKPQQ